MRKDIAIDLEITSKMNENFIMGIDKNDKFIIKWGDNVMWPDIQLIEKIGQVLNQWYDKLEKK